MLKVLLEVDVQFPAQKFELGDVMWKKVLGGRGIL